MIETLGCKLVDSNMELLWQLDNEKNSAREEVGAALTKSGKYFS